MNYIQPHLIQSHASLIGAPHKSNETNANDVAIARLRAMGANTPSNKPVQPIVSVSSGTGGRINSTWTPADVKVTGTMGTVRPDDQSTWDPTNGGRWVRPWLPGEKEAEAAPRMADVQNAQWEYRYTQEQKRQQEKIRSDMADIQSREDLTPEEKEYGMQALTAKLYGMPKMPHEMAREDEAVRYQREKDQRDYELKKQQNIDAKMANVFGTLAKPYNVKETTKTEDGPVTTEHTVVPDANETWQRVQGMFGAQPAPNPMSGTAVNIPQMQGGGVVRPDGSVPAWASAIDAARGGTTVAPQPTVQPTVQPTAQVNPQPVVQANPQPVAQSVAQQAVHPVPQPQEASVSVPLYTQSLGDTPRGEIPAAIAVKGARKAWNGITSAFNALSREQLRQADQEAAAAQSTAKSMRKTMDDVGEWLDETPNEAKAKANKRK